MPKRKTSKPKRDIYQEVTDKIIAALEAGVVPWAKPWRSVRDGVRDGRPYNGLTGRPYNGLNIILLGLEPCSSPEWFTYRQAKSAGGQVRQGERSSLVTFWRIIDLKSKDGKPEIDPKTGRPKKLFLLKHFNIFNREQIDGLPESKWLKVDADGEEQDDLTEDFDAAQAVLDALVQDGCPVHHGGGRAFYRPGTDSIGLPALQTFKDPESYWSTALHEACHATGHESRRNRPGIAKFDSFGSEQYAFEELVAEIGSAFLCHRVGVPTEGLQHASYLDHWLKTLKNDKRAIVRASSQAQKACTWLIEAAGLDVEDTEAQATELAAK